MCTLTPHPRPRSLIPLLPATCSEAQPMCETRNQLSCSLLEKTDPRPLSGQPGTQLHSDRDVGEEKRVQRSRAVRPDTPQPGPTAPRLALWGLTHAEAGPSRSGHGNVGSNTGSRAAAEPASPVQAPFSAFAASPPPFSQSWEIGY